MSRLQLATDQITDGTWVVIVTLATTPDTKPGELALERMADVAEEHDMTVAAWAQGPGMVFTAEVDTAGVGSVLPFAFRVAEQAG